MMSIIVIALILSNVINSHFVKHAVVSHGLPDFCPVIASGFPAVLATPRLLYALEGSDAIQYICRLMYSLINIHPFLQVVLQL